MPLQMHARAIDMHLKLHAVEECARSERRAMVRCLISQRADNSMSRGIDAAGSINGVRLAAHHSIGTVIKTVLLP
jgi:hypothetical protein